MGIINFSKTVKSKSYLAISLLGSSYKLNIKYVKSSSIDLVQNDSEFCLFLPAKYKNVDNMEIINSAIKKLYDEVAVKNLEYSLELARHIFKFAPDDYKIQRLKDSYYKCSKKVLTVNPDIYQYNQEIIDTTILQAFCKMQYKQNSNAYKNALEFALNSYEKYKKQQRFRKAVLRVS